MYNEKTGQSLGHGFVTFQNSASVYSALKFNGDKIDGQPIIVDSIINYKEAYNMCKKIEERNSGKDKEDEKQRTKRALLNQNDNKPLKKFKSSSEEPVARNVSILTLCKLLFFSFFFFQ